MTDERCQRYLEDPEGNAAHPAECDACRLLASTLDDTSVDLPAEVDVNALPLAAWEGAGHRPWPLVLSLAAGVFVLALMLCFAAGTSITRAVSSSAASFDIIRDLIRMPCDPAPHAPASC